MRDELLGYEGEPAVQYDATLACVVEKQTARYETAESFNDDELDHEEWPKMA
jgi:hypothetical protein